MEEESLKRSFDEANKENVPPKDSPPRMRRPNLLAVHSDSDFTLSLSNSKQRSASCLIACIIPAETQEKSKKMGDKPDFKWKDISVKGVVLNLDPSDEQTPIRIPFDKMNKDMKVQIPYQLDEIRKHYPDEVYTPFPDFCVAPYTVIEVKSFTPGVESVRPGDLITVTNLLASVNFTHKALQESVGGDETGRIRPMNLPHISFKGNVVKRGVLSAAELKKAISGLPLVANAPVNNRFLDANGNIVIPSDYVCMPNPSPACSFPVPLFTRLKPIDLFDLWRALYDPKISGFGVIRNRLGLYDEPPKEELEPRGGLPVFTVLNIPKGTETEHFKILWRKEKDGPLMKCARGDSETTNLIFARQQIEDQLGIFYADHPVMCLGFSTFESRSDMAVPQYVDGIGIISTVAWGKYIPGLFRGLEATIYVKIDPMKAKELTETVRGARDSKQGDHKLALCTHGIRGQTVLTPLMYKTLMGAGLRVSADVAIGILVEAQKNVPGKKIIPGILKSRYNQDDPYCTALIENRNSVRHFLVNAFDGDITDLPTSDDPQWDYYLVPAESTLHEIYEPDDLQNDLLLLRAQGFWLRNNDENWREMNDALAKEWCKSKNVLNEMGVFCARKEKS